MSINDLALDHAFPRNYECQPLRSVPTSKAIVHYYPGGTAECHSDGLLLKVCPLSDARVEGAWVGSFTWGKLSPLAPTGIYSWPLPNKLLILARGEAYLVDVNNPAVWEHLEMAPVLGVVQVSVANVSVVHNFTSFEGYDANSRRWQTPRLSWDGFRNVGCADHYILGESWDSPGNDWVPFRVNATDGSFDGGASPEL